MEIVIKYDDDREDEVLSNVYQFAITGVMSGPEVVIPIFTKSVIHDRDVLASLCDALKNKIIQFSDANTQ